MLNTFFGGKPICIITGHYGVGKTNLAINLALESARQGFETAIADLDLVNPYFRTSDYAELMGASGVEVLSPTFAGTTLDTPSVGGKLFTQVELAAADPRRRLIVDVGGDDAGATALGRYAHALAEAPVRMLYVANAFRDIENEGPSEAAQILREIEGASHLTADGVVNNSHLAELTQAADVERGREWARELCRELGLPLVATCMPVQVFESCYSYESGDEPLIGVGRYVITPW